MNIEKRTIIRERQRPLKPARYKVMDTGEKEVMTVIDAEGREQRRERPIKSRVFVEATYRTVQEPVDYWVVVDGDEEHMFTDKRQARKFMEDSCLRRFK